MPAAVLASGMQVAALPATGRTNREGLPSLFPLEHPRMRRILTALGRAFPFRRIRPFQPAERGAPLYPRHPRSRLLPLGTACLFGISSWMGPAVAQVPFPPASLLAATTPQQAATVLGAGQAERSGHLLIDAPDVVSPGPYRVTVESRIPGTSLMVVLRTPAPPIRAKPPVVDSGLTVLARRLGPAERAFAQIELEAAGPSTLVFYVFAQGRWFATAREVKTGQPVLAP